MESSLRASTSVIADVVNKTATSGAAIRWVVCGLLVTLVLAAHVQALQNGFVNYDDPASITENSYVQQGVTLGGLKYALFGADDGYVHAIPTLSFMLDSTVAGINPRWFHSVSLGLHACNVILLFLLFASASGNLLASGLVAALFAVHPVNVESVAWATERKGLLNAFFFLAALWLYVVFVKSGRTRYLLASLSVYVASLLCKPMSLTLPFVLLLLDFWPLNRIEGVECRSMRLIRERALPLLREKIPYFAVALVFSVLTFSAENRIGNVAAVASPSVAERTLSVFSGYAEYLCTAFVPVHLIPFYPPGQVAPDVRLLTVLGGFVLAFVALRKLHPVCCGTLWFVVMLLPVINIVPHGVARLADRYAYLPFIGLFVACVFGGFAVHRGGKQVVSVLCGAAIVALIGFTRAQVPRWHDSVSLFGYTLQVCPENYIALNNVAWELMKTNTPGEKLDPAIVAMAEKACKLSGFTNRYVLDTLQTAYAKNGEFGQADRVLEMEMSFALAHGQNRLAVQLMKQREKLGATEQTPPHP